MQRCHRFSLTNLWNCSKLGLLLTNRGLYIMTEITKRMPKKLADIYRVLSAEPNSPLSFIANVIYTSYGASRKKKLMGLYNIVNGGPRHYWNPCHVTFAPFSMEKILCTPQYPTNRTADGREIEGYVGSIKEIDVDMLEYYA